MALLGILIILLKTADLVTQKKLKLLKEKKFFRKDKKRERKRDKSLLSYKNRRLEIGRIEKKLKNLEEEKRRVFKGRLRN